MSEQTIFPTYTRLQTLRAYAALPAAGAWDATPVEAICAEYSHVTLYISYLEVGQSGAMDFQIQISPFSEDQPTLESWFDLTAYAVGAVVSGADTQSLVQANYVTFEPVTADDEGFAFEIDLDETVQRIRVLCRESGAVADPGFCRIIGVFS